MTPARIVWQSLIDVTSPRRAYADRLLTASRLLAQTLAAEEHRLELAGGRVVIEVEARVKVVPA